MQAVSYFRTLFTHTAALTSKRCLSTSNGKTLSQIEAMRNRHIGKGEWGEKEPMDLYLKKALKASKKFASAASLSPEEQKELQKIEAWYWNKYVSPATTKIPFIPLKAIGKTFEESRGAYLKKEDVFHYMHNGFVGLLPIFTLSSPHMKAISDRFPNFNQNYYKNLGSLYSALRNKCLFDLASNAEILAKVSTILGNNIQLSNMTVHEIGAGSGKSSDETGGMVDAFNCHSDVSSGSHYYFKPEGNQVQGLALDNRGVCVWISISGTTALNSPLYMFPRTHLWEITTPFTHIQNALHDPLAIDHVFKLLAFNHKNPARRIGLCALEYEYLLSSQYQTLLPRIKRTEIYAPPGSIVMFNQHCRHGSGMNYTQKARLAISLRFNTAHKEIGGTELAGAVVNQQERLQLGLSDDPRKPMVQLLGNKHHPNNVPIDLKKLANEAH